jgi:hypothetical protein
MKLTHYVRMPILVASVAVLASCGGGGEDEAGADVAFSISPAEVTQTWTTATCGAVDNVATVYVYGGAAPYQLNNTFPDVMKVDKSTVPKNGSFTVSLLGGCFSPGIITVVDALGRTTNLTINSTGAGT